MQRRPGILTKVTTGMGMGMGGQGKQGFGMMNQGQGLQQVNTAQSKDLLFISKAVKAVSGHLIALLICFFSVNINLQYSPPMRPKRRLKPVKALLLQRYAPRYTSLAPV